jgi:Amt family ammonium transporter
LFFGRASQLGAQTAGVVALIVFVFGLAYLVFQALGRTVGNRVTSDAELEGLDVAELGSIAYPDFGGGASRDNSSQ